MVIQKLVEGVYSPSTLLEMMSSVRSYGLNADISPSIEVVFERNEVDANLAVGVHAADEVTWHFSECVPAEANNVVLMALASEIQFRSPRCSVVVAS